ncbi:MAG: conserved hypothetical protein [Methanobrevibacter sp. CfCl-M3]
MEDMKMEFNKLKKYYDNNNFEEVIKNELGLYFLKLCSISRVKYLRKIADKLNINHENISGQGKLFEFMFVQNIDEKVLNDFINEEYLQVRNEIIENEEYLYSQLYKLKYFGWGGFYQNSVERTRL